MISNMKICLHIYIYISFIYYYLSQTIHIFILLIKINIIWGENKNITDIKTRVETTRISNKKIVTKNVYEN